MSNPNLILKKFFNLKQKKNPSYSMRSLARDLKLTPAFISRLLSGKQDIPVQRLDEFAKILQIDALSLKELKIAIAKKQLKELGLSERDFDGFKKTSALSYDDKPQTTKEISVLSPWYNIAIMEMATCENFKNDSAVIAKKLGIQKDQAQKSLEYLISNEYLQEENGTLKKTNKKIRLATTTSAQIVRSYHKSMIELAVKDMQQNTDSESFGKRLITSTSIAVNSAQIPLAKEKLAEAQLEIAEILTSGPCDEVYDLTLLLFPLTK